MIGLRARARGSTQVNSNRDQEVNRSPYSAKDDKDFVMKVGAG